MKIKFDISCCDHHRCHEKTCNIKAPHAHTIPGHKHDDCLTCVRDHLRNIFPLQEKISKSNLPGLIKQFLVTTGFLGTAIPVAKIASAGLRFLNINNFISSLITAPASISAMHFLNRGNKNLDKWGLTVASSAGALGLAQIITMPRFLLRFIMCFAVFFIERLRPEQTNNNHEHHDHNSSHCSNPHHKHESDHSHSKKNNLKKEDFINLGKVQALILTVPQVVDYFVDKLESKNNTQDNFLKRFLGKVGITVFHVLSLSAGFVGLGRLLDLGIKQFNLKPNEGTTVGKAEAVIDVCAHCGVPGCIDSITESVDASVITSIAA